MLRLALAGLMAMHGVAHLVGFAVPWRLLQAEEMPYSTTLLAGRLDVGDVGIRLVGLVWLGLAVAFVASAVGVWMERPGWTGIVLGVTAASLAMSVLGWPAARIGVFVNLALAVALVGGRGLGWL